MVVGYPATRHFAPEREALRWLLQMPEPQSLSSFLDNTLFFVTAEGGFTTARGQPVDPAVFGDRSITYLAGDDERDEDRPHGLLRPSYIAHGARLPTVFDKVADVAHLSLGPSRQWQDANKLAEALQTIAATRMGALVLRRFAAVMHEVAPDVPSLQWSLEVERHPGLWGQVRRLLDSGQELQDTLRALQIFRVSRQIGWGLWLHIEPGMGWRLEVPMAASTLLSEYTNFAEALRRAARDRGITTLWINPDGIYSPPTQDNDGQLRDVERPRGLRELLTDTGQEVVLDLTDRTVLDHDLAWAEVAALMEPRHLRFVMPAYPTAVGSWGQLVSMSQLDARFQHVVGCPAQPDASSPNPRPRFILRPTTQPAENVAKSGVYYGSWLDAGLEEDRLVAQQARAAAEREVVVNELRKQALAAWSPGARSQVPAAPPDAVSPGSPILIIHWHWSSDIFDLAVLAVEQGRDVAIQVGSDKDVKPVEAFFNQLFPSNGHWLVARGWPGVVDAIEARGWDERRERIRKALYSRRDALEALKLREEDLPPIVGSALSRTRDYFNAQQAGLESGA
ncbi:MAG: hypothetical protein HY600_03405 [Candidatus Omnitrophica bacterium]|nr:hypothetical protein [Candidatus Omnitrophota bacterium]